MPIVQKPYPVSDHSLKTIRVGAAHNFKKITVIANLRITFSLFLKASLGAHLSYENEISFTCKLNSFSYEWLCTRPRFEREALGNSEMVYLVRCQTIKILVVLVFVA